MIRCLSEPPSASPVCSHNEWDPLEEVIVGSVIGAAQMGYEPSLIPYASYGLTHFTAARRSVAEIDRAEAQLNGLADLLTDRGIIVRRPDPADYFSPVATPDFEVPCGNSHTCPRDVLLVLGEEIIVAPMSQRARFFEYRAYRSILVDYLRRGARWTAAPRPRLDDCTYHQNYSKAADEVFDAERNPFLTDAEPCFDAASFVRMGTDIFYQPDVVTNDLGAQWLQRHLGYEYRVWRMPFSDRRVPQHVDTTFVPLRPGLAMVNPERPCDRETRDWFRGHHWELVDAPASIRDVEYYSPEVSNWISMNVLSLDPDTVLVEEQEQPIIRLLESLGMTVVTCPFESVYSFGGGFHCCTTDVRRRGELRSYLPYR
jgi:glycine amidinotransferase